MMDYGVSNRTNGADKTARTVNVSVTTRRMQGNKVEVEISVAGLPTPFHVGETKINSTDKHEKDAKTWAASVAEKLRREGRSFPQEQEDLTPSNHPEETSGRI